MGDNNDEIVLPDNSESMKSVTTYDKESLIGRIFPEDLFDDNGSVKSGDSTTIDLEDIKIRIKEMPKFTPEQEREFEEFLEANQEQLSFKSGENILNTQGVKDELNALVKENPPAGTGDDQGAAAAGPPPPPQKPESINVDISKQELIDAINESNKQLNPNATNVETTDEGLFVTVQNINQGGKSKKKQMKPKNKSNKKMKKKQTKKGGKQIKKRSLKRKMKK